ncbi:related to Probable leucine aminopeptidase MCYG_04170 [Rhynchosporium graminicola]|uniref:Peptide hydrolase n=1 Tax=Rhynchosporium graminicola TaxID=2792576 RepID=A0A1E1LGZ1_9HELO|nr:related to Probable leucine aminopeptidase MCYG_04170 [Rhynchosporium commune]
MYFKLCLSALVASSSLLVSALPSTDGLKINGGLRLIKTSEADPGRWVTEDQKIEEYTAKNIHFIDITDITDLSVLDSLSGVSEGTLVSRQAISYPTILTHVTEGNAFIAKINMTVPQTVLKTFTEFTTRYYRSATGTQASTWLFNQLTTIGSANSAITVTEFTHSFNMPSIIVKIPGTSPNIVIVGAHIDSVGSTSTGRAPGADDDGSGTVTILEALRVLATQKFAPKNTLEFHFYAGEEGGLLGSAAIFANYKAAGKKVLAMLNQDMTGYSPGGKPVVFTDYTNAALNAYLRVIVRQYTGITAGTSTCGYGCSDHASATSNGFPASFVHEDTMGGSSPYIHSPSDTYSTIMWDAVLRHTKLTIGFLVEASYL